MSDHKSDFSGRVREWRLRAGPAEAGQRLDQVWSERLQAEGVSRGRLQAWIREGLATVDGRPCRKPGLRLAGGETLALRGDMPETCAAPEEGELAVLHRDESLLVINKPAGLTVHPAPSCPEGTLVHRLLHHFPELAGLDAWRPGIVHRLDKDTSGLIVVALNERTRLRLTEDFSERRVSKTYLALVHGRPEPAEATIDLPMGRHPTVKTRMAVLKKGGREALTSYRTLWASPDAPLSLLEVRIRTGRTHQIRVHLSHAGHPILGDRTYGAAAQAALERELPAARLASRQMLHAWRLAFRHPEGGDELSFMAAPPLDFRRLPLLLSRRVQRAALIGPAGCGKSAVLAAMARRGVPTISSDRIVAGLYRRGGHGWQLLRSRYGDRFVPDEGADVDKRALLAAMLGDDHLRWEIMDMIHPLVQHEIEEFWRSSRRDRLAVAEIPLLVETGWHRRGVVDVVLGVECSEPLRRERLGARTGWGPAVAASVDSWQLPWAEKRKACDLIIENSGGLDELDAATSAALDELRRMRRTRVLALGEELERLWS